ncbi:MAG: HD domain-containing protein [Candidatus Aminicenantes bacterium]|nr:HD domain-containing protein [Candidatus Aminicenantes bacterium]
MEERVRILVVDDQKKRGRGIQASLQQQDFQADLVPSLSTSEKYLKQLENYALLVFAPQADFNGLIELLSGIKSALPSLEICLLGESGGNVPTANPDIWKYLDAFLHTDNLPGLILTARNTAEKNLLKKENSDVMRRLKRLQEEQKEFRRHAFELEEVYDTTLENLMTALDIRDVETFGHSRTVAKYSQVLAQLIGIHDKAHLDNIRKGALLHDVGKIAIPDSILKKPGELTPKEWKKIRMHPVLGYGLVKEIKLLHEVGSIILHHHERFDGEGYPIGLKEQEIPIEARIFSVADALDAITSHRPYRKRREFTEAKKEIEIHSGTQFDPDIVKAFQSLKLEKWEKIRYESTKLLPNFEEMIKMTK